MSIRDGLEPARPFLCNEHILMEGHDGTAVAMAAPAVDVRPGPRVGLMRLIERFEPPDQTIDNAACWHLAGLRNDLARAIPAASDSKIQEACERLVEMQGRLLTIRDADDPPRQCSRP